MLHRVRLKKARKQAHYYFDQLWKTGHMTRNEAYIWLADKMMMSPIECHMAKMSIPECERVVELVTSYPNNN